MIPTHLKKWTLPDSYMGPTFYDYYVFMGQNRDSDLLTQSNFICALEQIGGETETVQVIRQGHWACGWIELIIIHESDDEALKKADSVMKHYKNYPVVDEYHFSEFERDAVDKMTKDNMDYFLRDLLDEVGVGDVELTKDDRKTLEDFIHYAVHEDASYRGADEAFFRPSECHEYIDDYILFGQEFIKGKNAELILLSLIREN